MTSADSDQKSSVILKFLTLSILIDAAAVVGAIALYQVIETSQPSLTMITLVLLLPVVGAKRLLGEKLTLAFGDLIAVCAAVLFGPGPAVIVAVTNRAMASIGMKDGTRKLFYNVASCAVSMNAAIYATRTLFPSFGESPAGMSVTELVAATGLSTASYFLLSIALVTAYEALSNEESFFALIKASFLWDLNQAASERALCSDYLSEAVEL